MKYLSILFILFTSMVHSQDTSIWIGGLDLRLGMTEAEVKGMLNNPLYNYQSGDGCISISKNNGSEYEPIGFINFTNNKLVSITRNWDIRSGEELVESYSKLFYLFNNNVKSGQWMEISTHEDHMPEFEEKEITFSTLKVQIHIRIFKHNIQITETLRELN